MAFIRRAAALWLLLVGAAAAEPVTVFAAASLKTALDEVAAGLTAETGQDVVLSYAGSSTLARQIERGAPADVFISANPEWMDRLEAGGWIVPETRRDLLGNRLVLVAKAGSGDAVDIATGFDLAGRLNGGRLAMALVDAVPAGIYGKAALTDAGLWETAAPHVVETDNVRAALKLVAIGEAVLGVVYATDARAEPRVAVIGHFPEASHAPIVYPVAAVEGRDGPAVRRFLDHLSGELARDVFERHGFAVLAE